MAPVLDPEGAHLRSLRHLADFENARILEVGCGDGRLTMPLAQQATSVFAFDPDAEAVANARSRLAGELAERVTLRVGSARQVEIPRTHFDMVVFSWSF